MPAKNTLKNDSFKFTIRYKAVCKEKDLKSEWRATEKEAIQDALAHQKNNVSHILEILVQQTNSFVAKIDKNKLNEFMD